MLVRRASEAQVISLSPGDYVIRLQNDANVSQATVPSWMLALLGVIFVLKLLFRQGLKHQSCCWMQKSNQYGSNSACRMQFLPGT